MFYLVDPSRNTKNFIHVIATSSTGNFPNQVSCGGSKFSRNGKQNTGQSKSVSCVESGADDLTAEIYVDSSSAITALRSTSKKTNKKSNKKTS